MGGHRKIIIGNWKMHFTVKQAVSFAAKLAAKTIPEGVTVAIAPHALALNEIAIKLEKTGLKLAAQNAYFQDEGAYTGEISMPMLRGIAQYVLIGHSERRHIFHESDEVIQKKVAAAVRSGVKPVLCIGETLVERQHGHTNQVLNEQLSLGVANLTAEEVAKIIIAYEPVWAISHGADFSTHKLPSPEDVQKAQQVIRQDVASLYGRETAAKVKIIYGGSTSAETAQSFLAIDGIDGLLPGGASLSLETFWPIVEKASKLVPVKINVKK